MKPKLPRLNNPWVMLLLATALAGGVAYLAYAYLQHREQRIQEEVAAKAQQRSVPKTAVVVPADDAGIGVVVDLGRFVARPIETDLVYPGTVTAEDFEKVRGQRLARPVLRGRPLRFSDLQVPEVNDVASVLPEGTRAVTIDIDNVNSIAQTLRPGHRVDVFLLSKAERPAGSGEVSDNALNQASLFMQDMQVLATGQEFQDINSTNREEIAQMVRPGEIEGARERGFDTVTLLVTPAQAAKLLVGQKMGSYRIALRGKKDQQAVAMAPLTGGDLLPRRLRAETVEMIVGGQGQAGTLQASQLAVAMRTPAQPAAPNAGGAQMRDAIAQTLMEMSKTHAARRAQP